MVDDCNHPQLRGDTPATSCGSSFVVPPPPTALSSGLVGPNDYYQYLRTEYSELVSFSNSLLWKNPIFSLWLMLYVCRQQTQLIYYWGSRMQEVCPTFQLLKFSALSDKCICCHIRGSTYCPLRPWHAVTGMHQMQNTYSFAHWCFSWITLYEKCEADALHTPVDEKIDWQEVNMSECEG
jgi:hypothetical protein